jgi:PAS domain S-box-containing protein
MEKTRTIPPPTPARAREDRSQWLTLHRTDHLVQFYEDEAHLIDSVSIFIGTGFGVGDAAIAISTPEHRSALEVRMRALGLDVTALVANQRLIFLDAEETLARFMVDGWPDEERFFETVGGLVARTLKGRRGLRAFGEMVAILWGRGLKSAAVRLEELWNDLAKRHEFSLFCAYPMAAFQGGDQREPFSRICSEHDHVISSESARRRISAESNGDMTSLRHRNESLEAAIDESRATEFASRRLAAIVESSFDAIVSKDLDGIITTWNQAAERLFGYTAEEIIGKPVTTLIPPHLLGDEPRILARVRSGERVEPFETVRMRKDGRPVDVSLTVSPIRDRNGRIIGASKILRDITERRRYEAALAEKEEQLRQTQKMEAVGKLAGGIAHDFNNLLTAINGYSEMALGMVEEGSILQEFLLEIKKSGDRAASLTQQLLAYSRKQILAPTIFNLNATVAEMDRLLRRLIGEDIEVNCVLEPDLGLVKADAGQVQQILLNLVLNARDAMPQGGRITVETGNRVLDGNRTAALEAAAGSYVMLSVSDTGHGMSEEVMAKIFEPFFTTKGVGKGTGLGLSSVYGIVKQSGGSIEVESAPGQGSAFRVYLPLARPEDMAAASGRKSAAEGLPGSEVVLLVEDEETVRKFVHRTLSTRGYSLVEAKDGAAALSLGEKLPRIDLLLTDVVMPNLNGVALAERLKRTHPDMRVIFMSGYPDNELAPQGFDARSMMFIQKPFGPGALLQALTDFTAAKVA